MTFGFIHIMKVHKHNQKIHDENRTLSTLCLYTYVNAEGRPKAARRFYFFNSN
jgi:hypothetical protein